MTRAASSRVVAGLLVLGALIRLWHLVAVEGSYPFFHEPIRDSAVYVEQAREIGRLNLLDESVPFHSSFLYPVFMALVFALPGPNFLVLRLAQHVLGLLAGLVLYALTKRLMGPREGVVAMAIYMVYPPIVFFESEIIEISLVLLLLAVGFLALARKSPAACLVAGLAFGLAVLGKPNIAASIPLLALWVLVRGGERARMSAAALVLGAALTVVPVTVRNYLNTGDFVVVSANGGINFFIGNNPSATGSFYLHPDLGLKNSSRELYSSSKRYAEAETGGVLTPSQVSTFWYGKGLGFWADDPLGALAITGRKVLLLLGDYEIPNLDNFYFLRRLSPVLYLPLTFGILLPLAVAGIWWSRTWRSVTCPFLHGALLLFIASYAVVLVCFFITARYRLPIVPFLIPYAACFVVGLPDLLKRPLRSRLVVAALFTAVAATSLCVGRMPRQGFAYTFHALGDHARGKGRLAEAKAYYRSAIEGDATITFSNFWLAKLYIHEGDHRGALEALKREMAVNPYFVDAYVVAADISAYLGDGEGALRIIEEGKERCGEAEPRLAAIETKIRAFVTRRRGP